jgi:hypothetical protein
LQCRQPPQCMQHQVVEGVASDGIRQGQLLQCGEPRDGGDQGPRPILS